MDTTSETRQDRLVSVQKAVATLGIGRSSTYKLIESGELRTVKIGTRRLVPESALAEFIARLQTSQTA